MSGVTAVRPSSTATARPWRDRSLAFKINAAVLVAVATAGAIAGVALSSIGSMADHAKAARETGVSSTAHSDMSAVLHEQSVATRNVLLILFIGIAIALFIGWRVARSVRTDVNKVVNVAEGLASGDLTRSARIDSVDEIGRLASALDRASAKLRQD
jgi:methyl-accepting chemotaxis protein